MKTYRMALIPGDGIGKEVIPAGVKVLEAAARTSGANAGLKPGATGGAAGGGEAFQLSFQAFDWGCEYYLRTGRMMPEDGLEQLRPFDAIYRPGIRENGGRRNGVWTR